MEWRVFKYFKANTIINNVDKLLEMKARNKLNVMPFLRAYSYFVLAQYYCLPYCEAIKMLWDFPNV